VTRVFVVVGHLREHVIRLIGDGSAFGLEVRVVAQPTARGSADAVQRAVTAGAQDPFLVTAADTKFTQGDVGRFARASVDFDAAIAVRRDPPPGPGRRAVVVDGGLVRAIADTGSDLSGAPLWSVAGAVVRNLCRDREPFELENAFRAALADGARIGGVEIGKTRDLTHPLDLVKENFPYLNP
jgi:NDP-sugar pyrophosphorylase family protein